MTLKTTRYDIFKKHISNRELNNENIRKIKRSISARNLLHLRPILVNSEMQIIDGQHRLQAAKELNIPIFYIIEKDASCEDILLLNVNQKKWTMKDYLNFFVSKNKEEYIKFDNMISEKRLSVDSGLALIGCTSGSTYKSFRSGSFHMPKQSDIFSQNYLLYKEITVFLEKRLPGDNSFLFKPNFIRSLFLFLTYKNIESFTFIKKIELNIDWMHRCSSRMDYISLFKKIYNYRNLSPIE